MELIKKVCFVSILLTTLTTKYKKYIEYGLNEVFCSR